MLRWWRRRKAPKAMETRALPGPDYGAASGCPRLSDGDVVPVNGRRWANYLPTREYPT